MWGTRARVVTLRGDSWLRKRGGGTGSLTIGRVQIGKLGTLSPFSPVNLPHMWYDRHRMRWKISS